MKIIKDNLILVFTCLSIIILGSILLSIFDSKEDKLVEKVYETKIYTANDFDYHSIVNRVDQIEIDIKLLKLALETEPVTNLIEKNDNGGSTVTWPPKFRFNLKAPSSLE